MSNEQQSVQRPLSRAVVEDLMAAGLSQSAIARQYGVSRQAVYHHLRYEPKTPRRQGPRRRYPKPAASQPTRPVDVSVSLSRAVVEELLSAGHPVPSIARQYGVSRQAVYHHLRYEPKTRSVTPRPDPPRMPRIELTLVGGAVWRWNPLSLDRAVVTPTGTALYVRSGRSRIVRETPEAIYAAVVAVTPEFGGRDRFLQRVRERLPAET